MNWPSWARRRARRARMTGNGHYDRLAHTLTSRAGEILDDLERSGKA